MSKERELLLLALDFLDPRRWLDPSDQHALNVITRDIELLLAQPEQTEPVAWMWDEMFCEDWTTVSSVIKPSKSKYVDNVRPLYTAPPKREPLSKEQYMKFFTDTYDSVNPITDFVRLVEKAHGIGGGE